MDKEVILKMLPEEPPNGLTDWVLTRDRKNNSEELGPEYMVFHSERVPVMPNIEEIMEFNDLRPHRWEWAARCSCTACENDFYTQKVQGADAIRLAIGEDGMPYTLAPGEPYAEYAWSDGTCVDETFDGEFVICPYCDSRVKLIHSRKLRDGRTKRIKIVTVQNIGKYTTIFYWIVCRKVTEYGRAFTWTDPLEAYVLDENGVINRYSHAIYNGFGSTYGVIPNWEQRYNANTIDTLYPDWGSVNNRKCGADIYDVFPDLEGTTGEKTGLLEFLRAGGYDAVEYLKFWKKHKCIENMVKCGQAVLVAGIFLKAGRLYSSLENEVQKYIDISQRKPHKMLRVSKDEFREIREKGIQLTVDHLDHYMKYLKHGGSMKLLEFLDIAPEFRSEGMVAALAIMEQSPETDLDKIARYMQKQQLHPYETQLLVDTRRMAKDAFPGRELTAEELWPRNLSSMHERLDRILSERRRMLDDGKKQQDVQKFQDVIAKYGQLQWTDGELCILLPCSSEDLHREGKVLRHCVGGYSNQHCSGSDTIFFVRHYRRPERPYYTLDICMTDGAPYEVQLHGYGNERHGINKEHKHSIPKKVRSFVDTWKKTVLVPWYVEQKLKNQKKEGKSA